MPLVCFSVEFQSITSSERRGTSRIVDQRCRVAQTTHSRARYSHQASLVSKTSLRPETTRNSGIHKPTGRDVQFVCQVKDEKKIRECAVVTTFYSSTESDHSLQINAQINKEN